MAAANPTSIAVVIDTGQYAGNFERQMCAFVTGQVGDCGVGSEIADEVSGAIRHLVWWTEHVVNEPDENDCCRPAAVWPTPGWFNNGSGGHYRDDPANHDRAVADAVASMRAYQARHGTEDEARIRDLERRRSRYPAYLSVAIFVDEEPPAEAMDELRDRVAAFAAERMHLSAWERAEAKPLEITDIRVVEPEPQPGLRR